MRSSTPILLAALALAACSGKREPVSPIDLNFGRLEQGAREAFERRDLDSAVHLYERLLAEARRSDDPSKVGDAAFNLAAVLYASGRAAERDLRPVLAEARAELARAGDALTDVDLLEARVELEAGDPAAALLVVEPLLSDDDLPGPARREARVLAGLARLALGEVVEARAELDRLERELDGREAPTSVWRLRARVHGALGEHEPAAAALDREADLHGAGSRYGLMARTLVEAGDAWERAGRPLEASDRWYRAERSRQGSLGSSLRPERLVQDQRSLARLLAALALLEPLLGEQAGQGGSLEAEASNLAFRIHSLVSEIRARAEEAGRGLVVREPALPAQAGGE